MNSFHEPVELSQKVLISFFINHYNALRTMCNEWIKHISIIPYTIFLSELLSMLAVSEQHFTHAQIPPLFSSTYHLASVKTTHKRIFVRCATSARTQLSFGGAHVGTHNWRRGGKCDACSLLFYVNTGLSVTARPLIRSDVCPCKS